MEATANNPVTLAERVNAYVFETRTTIQAIADEIHYSRSALSRYLNGSYDSDPKQMEAKLRDFITAKTGERFGDASQQVTIQKRSGLFRTADADGILGVCKGCHSFAGLGIVVGKSGFGKTVTLQEYAKKEHVAYVSCDDTMGCRDLVKAIEHALNLPPVYGSIWERVNGIRSFLNGHPGYLLIIDEADKLINKYTQKKMEILRSIFDQSKVGIVIAGEPKLESHINTFLERMANRIDFYTNLKGLAEKEVVEYLSIYDIDDEARKRLQERACNPKNGCFRSFDRMMDNVFRLLNNEGKTCITAQVIEGAARLMVPERR